MCILYDDKDDVIDLETLWKTQRSRPALSPLEKSSNCESYISISTRPGGAPRLNMGRMSGLPQLQEWDDLDRLQELGGHLAY